MLRGRGDCGEHVGRVLLSGGAEVRLERTWGWWMQFRGQAPAMTATLHSTLAVGGVAAEGGRGNRDKLSRLNGKERRLNNGNVGGPGVGGGRGCKGPGYGFWSLGGSSLPLDTCVFRDALLKL